MNDADLCGVNAEMIKESYQRALLRKVRRGKNLVCDQGKRTGEYETVVLDLLVNLPTFAERT